MPLFDDTRAAWGARLPRSTTVRVAASQRSEFFFHYDGGTPLNLPTHADCLARVRQDQAYHQNTQGWADIGYNGLVCQHGRAIEGRGIDFVGAHCPNHNTSGYGFQFMVGGNQVPSDAAKARMRQLYDDCVARSGHHLAAKGHRDGFATACPGEAAYSWVLAGMPTPRTTPVASRDTDRPPVTQPVPAKPAPAPAPKPAAQKGLNVKLIDLRNAHRVLVTGPGIKPLQRLLGVSADGKAGRQTQAALNAYQRRTFGKADNIFGPDTAEALLAGK